MPESPPDRESMRSVRDDLIEIVAELDSAADATDLTLEAAWKTWGAVEDKLRRARMAAVKYRQEAVNAVIADDLVRNRIARELSAKVVDQHRESS